MRHAIALILVMSPGLVMAQSNSEIRSDVSFSYIEVGMQGARYDLTYFEGLTQLTTEIDARAPSLELSFEVEDRFYMFGSVQSWEPDDYPDISLREARLGVGKNFNVGEKWALYGNIGIGSSDIFINPDPTQVQMLEDNFGFAGVGIRKQFFENIEIRLGAEYSSPVADQFLEEKALVVAGDVYLTDAVTLTFKLNGDSDYQEAFVGLRFYPGKDSSMLR